jgi:hypothetical protein
MLSRLACTKTFINPVLVKSAIQNAPKGPRQMFRTFANESRFQSRAERINERMSLKERVMAPAGPNAFAVGKGALAGGSLLGEK